MGKRVEGRSKLLGAGTYFIGDLCYVLDDAEWTEVCGMLQEDGFFDSGRSSGGVFELASGRMLAIHRTAYGDGEYEDQVGRTYGVDSGTLGCTRVKAGSKRRWEDLAHLGALQCFDKPFTSVGRNGIITFGRVVINTREDMDPHSKEEIDEVDVIGALDGPPCDGCGGSVERDEHDPRCPIGGKE